VPYDALDVRPCRVAWVDPFGGKVENCGTMWNPAKDFGGRRPCPEAETRGTDMWKALRSRGISPAPAVLMPVLSYCAPDSSNIT